MSAFGGRADIALPGSLNRTFENYLQICVGLSARTTRRVFWVDRGHEVIAAKLAAMLKLILSPSPVTVSIRVDRSAVSSAAASGGGDHQGAREVWSELGPKTWFVLALSFAKWLMPHVRRGG